MSDIPVSERSALLRKAPPRRSVSLHGSIDGSKSRAGRPALPKLQSYSVNRFLSSQSFADEGGVNLDGLRLSFAAKLVAAAVDGRHVSSAVDVFRGKKRMLCHPAYNKCIVSVVLAHMSLAFWEGADSPMSAWVLAAEAFVTVVYVSHILLNLSTFGLGQFRDKRWHATFTILAIVHILLCIGALCATGWEEGLLEEGRRTWCGSPIEWGESSVLLAETGGSSDSRREDGGRMDCPAFVLLLGAQSLRPLLLISQLATIRRVFSNVLRCIDPRDRLRSVTYEGMSMSAVSRTMLETKAILTLGFVVLTFYSVLGINLFNSGQVDGYEADSDNFDTYGAALLSLFVLITEENFPMVADPSFSQRPAVAFPFFLSFLIIFLVFILPLVLGIVLDAYEAQHVLQQQLSRIKARKALLAAYYVMDEEGLSGVREEQFIEVLQLADVGIGRRQDDASETGPVVKVLNNPAGNPRGQNDTGDLDPSLQNMPPHGPSSGLPPRSPRIDKKSSGGGEVGDRRGIERTGGGAGGRSDGSSVGSNALVGSSKGSSKAGGDSSIGVVRAGTKNVTSRVQIQRGKVEDVRSIKRDDSGSASGRGGDRARLMLRPARLASSVALQCIRVHEFLGLVDLLHLKGDPGGEWTDSEEEEDGESFEGGEDDLGDEELTLWRGRQELELKDEPKSRGEGQWEGEYVRFGAGMGPRLLSVTVEGVAKGLPGKGSVGEAEEDGGDTLEEVEVEARVRARPRSKLGSGDLCNRFVQWLTWGHCLVRQVALETVRGQFFQLFVQVETLLLVVSSVLWTPADQDRYDLCRAGDIPAVSAFCSMEYYSLWKVEGLLLLAFALEMSIKVTAIGWKGVLRSHWVNGFDLFVLVVSLIAYGLMAVMGAQTALYVDSHAGLSDWVELPRALRILRLLTVFPHLRELLEWMSTVASMLVKILMLYFCVSFSFAVVGMGLFTDTSSDELGPRYSFGTLPEALMSLFFLTVTNNWNDLLYPVIMAATWGRWTSIYFVMYMLFCSTIMLDILVGVVIEGLRVSKSEKAGMTALPADPTLPSLRSDDGSVGSGSHFLRGKRSTSSRLRSSLRGEGGGVSPSSVTRRQGRIAGTPSLKGYRSVGAEDMFRSGIKAGISLADVKELEEAVAGVEERLHDEWVKQQRILLRQTSNQGHR